MQNERSTARRRIGDNLYERTTKTGERRFVVGYLDDGGTWRMVTLRARTRTEAKAERDEYLAKLRRGEIAPVSKLTLAEFIDEYLEHFASLVAAGERAERTLERYRSHLDGHVVPLLGHVQLRKLSADHLAALVRVSREKGLAPWTIKGMLTPLGRVLSLAQRRGFIVENPLKRLQPEELPRGIAKDPPRVLSREEIATLIARAPERYRPIIGVAVLAGLRQAEVLGLRWSEIDFKAGVLKVRHQLTRGDRTTPPRAARLKTKAGRRDVILLADLAELLQSHLRWTENEHGLPRPDDFVFTTSTGAPMNYRNVSTRGLDKAAEAARLNPAEVAKLTFHDLRHTYGSHLAQSGLDPVGVQRQMGHARPSITMDLYVHEFETARRREQVSERLTAALGGLVESDKF
jgi:integrase